MKEKRIVVGANSVGIKTVFEDIVVRIFVMQVSHRITSFNEIVLRTNCCRLQSTRWRYTCVCVCVCACFLCPLRANNLLTAWLHLSSKVSLSERTLHVFTRQALDNKPQGIRAKYSEKYSKRSHAEENWRFHAFVVHEEKKNGKNIYLHLKMAESKTANILFAIKSTISCIVPE